MFYTYRSFIVSDLERCTQLSVDSWPVIYKLANKENSYRLMKLYVELCLLESDFTEVCCDNEDNVVGLLFGSISPKKLNKKEKVKRGSLIREYLNVGLIDKKMRFILSFILTEIKVRLLCSRFQSQVVLLMVDKECRGQGIGKRLMKNFISKAKNKNRKSIYLYTDIESNWKFYDIIGLKQYKSFYDNGLSIMLGYRIMSFIYYLDLNQ